MLDLNQLLGFDRNIAFLSKRFLEDDARRLAIRGPSGSGKTTVASALAETITQHACGVVWLQGDAGRTQENYYPIMSAIQPVGMARFFTKGTRVLEGIAEDFLPKGKATAKALISLLPQSPDESGAAQSTRAPGEFNSLLARLLKRRRVILIADDIQYFDDRTLALLDEIVNVTEPGDTARRPALLSVMNSDIELHPSRKKLLAAATATLSAVDLRYCYKEEFSAVLRAFGSTNILSKDTLDLLYDCSGGHLHIARFIAEELKTIQFSDIDPQAYSDLLHYVIQRRIAHSALEPDRLFKLLGSAAHIGRSFSRDELSCLSDFSQPDLRRSLKQAEDLSLVDSKGDFVCFSHEVVRSYFLKLALPDRPHYSAKYSECLRILRPYDYYARCISLIEAEDLVAARIAYCQGTLAEWRAGRTAEHTASDDVTAGLGDLGLDVSTFLLSMRGAHDALIEGDFRTAQAELTGVFEGVPDVLLAERDYLLAEALLKDLGESKSEEARSILSGWGHLREKEAELWCRMRLLLLLANVQLCRYEDARNVEREIILFLSARGKFDRGAERQLQRLLAVSEMHSSAEISQKRIVQACTFYEQKYVEQGFADFYEYFICLTNRSGNCITNLDLPAALNEGIRALELTRDYPTIRLPAQWAVANNVVVAALLDGRTEAAEAAVCLRELERRFPRLDDHILITANIGSLELLAGNLPAALDAFDVNTRRLTATPDMDPYYAYLSESNRAIALHLSGLESGAELWNSLSFMVPHLAPAMRHDIRTRHEVVGGLFNRETLGRLSNWKSLAAVIKDGRFRKARFPSGVFLTDIQIWSGF